MTLSGKADRSEGVMHGLVKWLIYFRCHELGNNAFIEYNTEGCGIIDCMDFSNQLAYEVQKVTSKKILAEKTEKYLKHAIIRDIIFVDLKKFDIDMSAKEIYEKIKEIVV